MKKKTYKILGLLTVFIILVSCSKKNDDEVQQEQVDEVQQEQIEQGYFPKTISLEYATGQMMEYELVYNALNHIEQIKIRRSDDFIVNYVTNFEYNENALPTKAVTNDITNGVDWEVSFSYDEQFSFISDIELISNLSEREISTQYNPLNHSYIVDGESDYYPLRWKFDENGQLLQMGIDESDLTLELTENNKGIFSDVTVQPALHIWFGMVFHLFSPELYFFSQKEIKSIATNEFPYLYDNKVRDDEGNLTSFQASYAGLVTIDYTISYENRNL